MGIGQQLKCLVAVFALLGPLACDAIEPRTVGYDSSGFNLYDEYEVRFYVRPAEVNELVTQFVESPVFPASGIFWQSPKNGRIYDALPSWVKQNFVYISDGGVNFWKTPAQMIADGGGDCEDYAILFASMFMNLYDRTGGHNFPELYLVRGYHPNGKKHVWAEVYWTVPEMPGEGYLIETSSGGVGALLRIGEDPEAALYDVRQRILINVGE